MVPISVWTVRTDSPLPPLYDSLLTADERAKAQRFCCHPDQQRYRVVRIALRLLLAATLDCAPATIRFNYSANGKPCLASPSLPWHFNVSHSGNVGLIGIANNRVIGVDLEVIKPKANVVHLAQRFFSPTETRTLRAQTGETQQRTFYQLWTAKEAFLKATGLGIGGGLNQVVLASDRQHYHSLPHPYQVADWQLFSLPLLDAYWGAIALQNSHQSPASITIQSYRWDDYF
ncbi:MAG: 4-phosphopantetheinyl transferase [Cyanobacteriota bacterium]|jgi:4'-phosphopantetheinyl transferase